MSNTETKVCKKCGVEKGVGEYSKKKGRKNHYSRCKKCDAEIAREKYNNSPEYKEYILKRHALLRRKNGMMAREDWRSGLTQQEYRAKWIADNKTAIDTDNLKAPKGK
jgi:hypothetical protein